MRISDWSSDVCSSDLADAQEAVIPHDKEVAVAEIPEDARHLVLFLREALEVVVADLAMDMAAGLIDDHQALPGAGDDDTGGRVHVDGAVEVGPGLEDPAVEVEARGRQLDRKRTRLNSSH